MPSRRINGYKLQFYSADKHEPPHIHVVIAEKRAKIWLSDLSIAWSRNFNQRELNKVLEAIGKQQQKLMDWYNGFFA